MMKVIDWTYDSHVHFFMTGQTELGLDLRSSAIANSIGRTEFQNAAELRSYVESKTNVQTRGDWIVGFGWEESQYRMHPLPKSPAAFLDEAFPYRPVCLTRIDGHSSWVNSKALAVFERELCRIQHTNPEFSIECPVKEQRGWLKESSKFFLDQFIPPYSKQQMVAQAIAAQKVFHDQGIVSVRDMTGNLEQFKCLCDLANRKEIEIQVEMNFVAESPSDLPRAISDLLTARQSQTKNIRVGGVKIFLDGSLGSSTARMFQEYSDASSDWAGPGRGEFCWPEAELHESIRLTWMQGFPICIHTIGDEAVDHAARSALAVQNSGTLGELHLEHVQVLADSTISILQSLNTLTCHLQPCHFLTDKTWLRKRLGNNRVQLTFPWHRLHRAGINFDFGSDSPIEYPNPSRNFEAIMAAKTEFEIPDFPMTPPPGC